MSPLKAIRKQCYFCSNKQSNEIRDCNSTNCFLHSYRMNKNESNPRVPTLKNIKAYCLDCSAGIYKDRRNCKYIDCALYPYRTGKNPAHKGKRHFASVAKKALLEPVLEINSTKTNNNTKNNLKE